MKTIEERAEESANNATIHKLSDSWYIHRNGYIKGATEQKKIDIEKACEWLLKNVSVNMDLPDTNCYLKSGWYWDFRKAMEE